MVDGTDDEPYLEEDDDVDEDPMTGLLEEDPAMELADGRPLRAASCAALSS